MRAQRSVLSTISVLIGTLMAVLLAGPAQAAPSPAREAVPARSLAAASPTVSPYANYVHVARGEASPTCPSGYLCTGVWDPAVGKVKIFFFFDCTRYSLSNWAGEGHYVNNQTGGAVAYFYGSNGQVLHAIPAQSGTRVDWNPVWSIRPC
ncbi:hypothetical protein [Streptomyces sp. NPDC007904]|jgi:hypothetical protein|uniref:hypothetical protein n=1 Tax=Streptomyces sp. NPDC007904 TaxID=3364787 RepID=UPI0036EF335E